MISKNITLKEKKKHFLYLNNLKKLICFYDNKITIIIIFLIQITNFLSIAIN